MVFTFGDFSFFFFFLNAVSSCFIQKAIDNHVALMGQSVVPVHNHVRLFSHDMRRAVLLPGGSKGI